MKTGDRRIPDLNSGGITDSVGISSAMVSLIRENFPAIVFWCSAIFILFWSLGVKGLWGPEDRWAEAVREMRLTGDYFHPMINGRPYFDKPLLSYWLITLTASVTGRLNEAAVRLPSAIAGMLALVAVISLGRRLWSDTVARTAGWLLLGTYGFIFWARTGEADMENMAAIILAVAWYWRRREKPGFLSYAVFYIICFLGAHAKGMATIAVPIVVILPDLIRERRWRSFLSISHFFALLTGFCVYLAPFIISDMTRTGYRDSTLALAIRENITRYFQPFDHKEPFYAYFYHLPKLLFPWIPLFLGAIWLFCARFKKLVWPSKWLAISVALIFLFFTMSGSRRSYYILPILPFCILMISPYINFERTESQRCVMREIQKWAFSVMLAAEILSPLIWLAVRKRVDFVISWHLLFATSCLGVLAIGWVLLSRIHSVRLAQIFGMEHNIVSLVAMSFVIIGGFFCWQDELLDSYRTIKPFSMELKSHFKSVEPVQVAFFRKFSIKTLFYMDVPEPALLLTDVDAVKPFLSSTNETRILVSHYDYHSELAGLLGDSVVNQPTLEEKVYPWEKEKKYEAWIIADSR